MRTAKKVEFPDRPAISLGAEFNGEYVERITVDNDRYEDHSETTIRIFSLEDEIGLVWNYPCIITYTED